MNSQERVHNRSTNYILALHRRAHIRAQARALSHDDEPAFVLAALARGFSDENIHTMQSYMAITDWHNSPFLLARVTDNGVLSLFYLYDEVGSWEYIEREWLFNVLTQEWNDAWPYWHHYERR
jgi:hypothetical protein